MPDHGKSDIIIIGGGMIGLSIACLLADYGIKITILESQNTSVFKEKLFDGRVSAIAYGSQKIFEKCNVWNKMSPHAGAILDIRVTDNDSPLFLHYNHNLVSNEPMGYIIENFHIRAALMEKIEEYDNIKILAPAKYKSIDYSEHFVTVTLENNDIIEAKLLVACDGRNSNIRKNAGIKVTEYNYKQTAIVCTVQHEKNHHGVAVEKFLPSGPFAMLPMAGGFYSSIVWTEKTELAPGFIKMNKEDFTLELGKRFGNWLGDIKLAGERWTYPISLTFAEKYISQRMCLVGDSAHAIHPIAGQGFNLGLRDVSALTELIMETLNLGLDIGGQTMLERYQIIRRPDNIQLIAVTDILNRLFSNNITPIKIARRIGLATVNKISPLKKIFVRHAMGMNSI